MASAASSGLKVEQRHGKSRVRVSRVWRRQGQNFIVEWSVDISLLSDCIPAYVNGDNSSIVATDTMKNTVYAKAKECSDILSVEEFAVLLGRHFTSFYPVNHRKVLVLTAVYDCPICSYCVSAMTKKIKKQ